LCEKGFICSTTAQLMKRPRRLFPKVFLGGAIISKANRNYDLVAKESAFLKDLLHSQHYLSLCLIQDVGCEANLILKRSY